MINVSVSVAEYVENQVDASDSYDERLFLILRGYTGMVCHLRSDETVATKIECMRAKCLAEKAKVPYSYTRQWLRAKRLNPAWKVFYYCDPNNSWENNEVWYYNHFSGKNPDELLRELAITKSLAFSSKEVRINKDGTVKYGISLNDVSIDDANKLNQFLTDNGYNFRYVYA